MRLLFEFQSTFCLFLFLFVFSFGFSYAQQPDTQTTATEQPAIAGQKLISISGPLQDTVIASATPYLVTSDIEVPLGKTVVIQPGTVFLFKNLTGLHVQGKLVAIGTKQRRIIFSSENDRAVNHATVQYPNPYDWNGIFLHADATGSALSFCNVNYSVYGIVSETKFIRIDPVMFKQNGKSNLVVEGKNLSTGDTLIIYTLSHADANTQNGFAKAYQDPFEFKPSVVRYSGFSMMLAGLAGGIYSAMQWKKQQDDLSAISVNAPLVLSPVNESDWFAIRNKRDNNRTYTGIGAIVFLLGAAGFYWSFTF